MCSTIYIPIYQNAISPLHSSLSPLHSPLFPLHSSLFILLSSIHIPHFYCRLIFSCHSYFILFLSYFFSFSISDQHTKRPYSPSSFSSSSSKKKGFNNLKDKDKDKDKDKEKDEIPTDGEGNTPCFLFMDSSSYHAAKRITDNLRL